MFYREPVKSKLVDGFIVPPTHFEVLAVDHCNITCQYCNHASPLMPAWNANPDTVYKDYSILAKYYRPKFAKILGGEPLLHPNLDLVIQAARASGISKHFVLTTNGTLLHTAKDAIWEAIDEIEISLYPCARLSKKNLSQAQNKAESFGKKFTIFEYEQFRATFALHGTSDKEFIKKVFSACKVANIWGCHAARDGYFYKCPQSAYISLMKNQDARKEGLPIVDSPSFQSELLEYVNSPNPLDSCAYCAGTVGKKDPACLLPRKEWEKHIEKTLEEIVDYDWLDRSLVGQDQFDDCKYVSSWILPNTFSKNILLKRISKFFWPVVGKFWMMYRQKRSIRQSAEQARQLYKKEKK